MKLEEINKESFDDTINVNLPKIHTNRFKRQKRWMGKEFHLDSQINGFDIKNVMLDLGSDVNILLKKSWEDLGWPKLVYSPIKLWMENKYFIFPIGSLENIEVDLINVKPIVDFEVIEITGDKYTYPCLLGI